MKTDSFKYGIDTLLLEHADWIENRNIAMVCHPASVDSKGTPSYIRMLDKKGLKLKALMGPEHGFIGNAGAGVKIKDNKHSLHRLPIFSLYGDHRKPTREMLKGIDTIIYDLQDISVRCYTYVSTLRYIIEAASEWDLRVIITDRPSPLAHCVDGPILDNDFESFVGCIPAPLCYGMTSGETALWLKEKMGYHADIKIAQINKYSPNGLKPQSIRQWIPPSPSIISWESALCYPSTVFTEAITSIDCGRSSGLPFQAFGASWINSSEVIEYLASRQIKGINLNNHQFRRHNDPSKRLINGIRITVTEPTVFKPVSFSIELISCLQDLYGKSRLWKRPDTRCEWFDKLYGTSSVRSALMDNDSAPEIYRRWNKDLMTFTKERTHALIYRRIKGQNAI